MAASSLGEFEQLILLALARSISGYSPPAGAH
jgi:hypothetical protein